jgi:predicted dehydrogenase
MASAFSRRSFLRRASLATAAAGAAGCFPLTNILHAATKGDKLRCAVIGCGGRGMLHVGTASGQQLVAIADADEKRHDAARKEIAKKGREAGKLATFTDYRPLFDKLGKQLDAVFIATPNHQHAPPSLIAMQLGIGVYCEKPLCHDIAEARRLAATARKSKVPTQMGNQGHCGEGYRRLCEYVWADAIGPIKETHSWCDRSNGGVGPRPPTEHAPTGMHWNEWIGPAPYRDFHKDLHPHEWHGWYDFGNGSLGNMACHVLDGVFWSLKLGHPVSIEAESINGGSDERYPVGTRIRWDFPARGKMPAVKVYWYDGRQGEGHHHKKKAKNGDSGRYLPPLLVELMREHRQEKFDSNGTLYVGEKGILYTGTYGGGTKIVGKAKGDVPQPPKTLPRPGDIAADFFRACRAGKTDTAAAFDYSARLTEFALLGNLAQHAGAGKLVQWDGPGMKVTNLTELNAWINRPYRQGWQVG